MKHFNCLMFLYNSSALHPNLGDNDDKDNNDDDAEHK